MGQEEKAISTLLKVAFKDDLADNSEAIRQLKTLLRNQRVPLKTTLDTALRRLYTKPSGKGEPKYYFQFLGHEIKAPYVWSEITAGEEAVRKAMKEFVFYTVLTAALHGRAKKEGRRKNRGSPTPSITAASLYSHRLGANRDKISSKRMEVEAHRKADHQTGVPPQSHAQGLFPKNLDGTFLLSLNS